MYVNIANVYWERNLLMNRINLCNAKLLLINAAERILATQQENIRASIVELLVKMKQNISIQRRIMVEKLTEIS